MPNAASERCGGTAHTSPCVVTGSGGPTQSRRTVAGFRTAGATEVTSSASGSVLGSECPVHTSAAFISTVARLTLCAAAGRFCPWYGGDP
jgi:hypothetical protein